MRIRRRERGALLGIVIVLLAIILAAGVFALYGLKTDTGAAGGDRLSRQLFDCAEEGLAVAKQFFSQPAQRGSWSAYFSTNMCSTFSCPPFPLGQSGTPPTGYPGSLPFLRTLQVPVGTSGSLLQLQYQIGIYNNPGDPGNASTPIADTDNQVVVISRCTDLGLVGQNGGTGRTRTVQALLSIPPQSNSDYFGQAGGSFRGQGNTNNNY